MLSCGELWAAERRANSIANNPKQSRRGWRQKPILKEDRNDRNHGLWMTLTLNEIQRAYCIGESIGESRAAEPNTDIARSNFVLCSSCSSCSSCGASVDDVDKPCHAEPWQQSQKGQHGGQDPGEVHRLHIYRSVMCQIFINCHLSWVFLSPSFDPHRSWNFGDN